MDFLTKHLKSGIISITKSTAQAGIPTIILIRWKVLNPEKDHFLDLVRFALMHLDVLLNEDDNFIINGLYILEDMQGFSPSYLLHLTPTLCKKIVLCVQSAYPLRVKGLYFINATAICETFINLFKPFLNEKLKNRIAVFREGELEKFSEYIPLEVLPEEYGGKAGSLSKINGEFKAVLENYKNWFNNDDEYGSDESRRPGKPRTSADIFGVEGSFRKLNID